MFAHSDISAVLTAVGNSDAFWAGRWNNRAVFAFVSVNSTFVDEIRFSRKRRSTIQISVALKVEFDEELKRIETSWNRSGK